MDMETPLRCASLTMSLAESLRVPCLLCLSIRAGSNELIQLSHLERAKVLECFSIPKATSSCEPSGRVSKEVVNPAFLDLGVFHKSWL